MKIFFLIRSLNRGGAERQLVLLAKRLEQQHHCVSVGCFYSGGSLESELRDTGVRVTSFNKLGRWDVFGFLLRLVRFVKQECPDIVHGYLGISNILTVLLKLFFPHIHAVWGIRASNMDLMRYDWFWRFSFFFGEKAFQVCRSDNSELVCRHGVLCTERISNRKDDRYTKRD
ncbi:MAG: glycosyltransferase [Deltaproteobacteria bacterium]|nr:glycosyltransferase [Deltaproteobacteria bacterium]